MASFVVLLSRFAGRFAVGVALVVGFVLSQSAHASVEVKYMDEGCRSAEVRWCLANCYGSDFLNAMNNGYRIDVTPEFRKCREIFLAFPNWRAVAQQGFGSAGAPSALGVQHCDAPLNPFVAANCTRTAVYSDAKDLQAQLAETQRMMKEDVIKKVDETRTDFIREVQSLFDRLAPGDSNARVRLNR